MKLIVFLVLLSLSGCAFTQKTFVDCQEECHKQMVAKGVVYDDGNCDTSCIFQFRYPF